NPTAPTTMSSAQKRRTSGRTTDIPRFSFRPFERGSLRLNVWLVARSPALVRRNFPRLASHTIAYYTCQGRTPSSQSNVFIVFSVSERRGARGRKREPGSAPSAQLLAPGRGATSDG